MRDLSVLTNEISDAIKAVCDTHGFKFFGLNAFKDGDTGVRCRFSVSAEERNLTESDREYLNAIGVTEEMIDSDLTNPIDGYKYRIIGINKENQNLPIVLRMLESGQEFLVSSEQLFSYKAD